MFTPRSSIRITGKVPGDVSVTVDITATACDVPAGGPGDVTNLCDVHNVVTCVLIAVKQALVHLTQEPEPEPQFRVINFAAAKASLEAAEKGKGD